MVFERKPIASGKETPGGDQQKPAIFRLSLIWRKGDLPTRQDLFRNPRENMPIQPAHSPGIVGIVAGNDTESVSIVNHCHDRRLTIEAV
jgi:hypothetical protein